MREPYVYCIFRLNTKYYHRLKKDLKEYGYTDVKPVVPTVSILRKTKKGINTYEDIPMLFNYGFMKMKAKKAYDRNFLQDIKRDIPGVMSFMKSLETLHPKKLRKRVDVAEIWDDFSQVATISREQVKYYLRISKRNRIYSNTDILNLTPGDFITLRGYPYDGLNATIKEVNGLTKTVDVVIEFGRGMTQLKLPLDNVLYSIYHGYDENQLEALDYELDMSTIPDN